MSARPESTRTYMNVAYPSIMKADEPTGATLGRKTNWIKQSASSILLITFCIFLSRMKNCPPVPLRHSIWINSLVWHGHRFLTSIHLHAHLEASTRAPRKSTTTWVIGMRETCSYHIHFVEVPFAQNPGRHWASMTYKTDHMVDFNAEIGFLFRTRTQHSFRQRHSRSSSLIAHRFLAFITS